MRRPLLVLALSTLVLGTAAGCSKSSDTQNTQGTTASTPAQGPATSKGPSTSKTQSTSSKSGGTSTSAKSAPPSLPGVSTPSLPNVPGVSTPSLPNVPGVDTDKFQKCIELATAYSATMAPLASGSVSQEQIEAAQAELQKVKETVPTKVADALTVIEDGIKANAGNTVALADFFNSDDYQRANDEVTSYLNSECGQVGG